VGAGEQCAEAASSVRRRPDGVEAFKNDVVGRDLEDLDRRRSPVGEPPQTCSLGGEEVGSLRGLSDRERLDIADEFIRGDFAALRARPWGS